MYFDKEEFRKRIKDLRVKNGMTQTEASERLNIGLKSLQSIEQGRRECSLEMLLDLSELYKVSTDYLLKGTVLEGSADRERLAGVIAELTLIMNGK